jgi:hypothetical protein
MQNVEGFCWFVEINFEGKLYAYFSLTETGCEKCKYIAPSGGGTVFCWGGGLMLGNIGDRVGGGQKYFLT